MPTIAWRRWLCRLRCTSIDKIKCGAAGIGVGERYIDIGSGKPGRTTGAKGCRRMHTAHLIAQLPALQQTIIRMKDIEGYELAEIAEITATPVENVRVNLSRARKKIHGNSFYN